MNTNELITVVALADKLQVAKQTIFYHCHKLQIEAKKIDNVSYLTRAEAEAIKQRINKKNKHTNNRRDTDQSEATENNSNNAELIELLKEQINDLKIDKAELTYLLKQQQTLLSQQQSLQLQSNEKIKALEIELNDIKEDNSNKSDTSVDTEDVQRDNKVDNFYRDLKNDRSNQKQSSFLSRLFKR